MANSIKCGVTGSSLTTVSTPVIGDEYVLVKKVDFDEKKDKVDSDEKKAVKTLLNKSSIPTSMSKIMNPVKTQLVYDHVYTPSTSSALASYVAVSGGLDTQATTYWKYLFAWYRVDKAVLELNFAEYMNMVGTADKFSAMLVSFRATSSAAVPGYTSISDDTSCKVVNWSQARPIFRYVVPKSVMKTVRFQSSSQMAVGPTEELGRWAPLTDAFCQGWIHIATYDPFNAGTSGRKIYARLILDVTLTNRI